MERFEAALRTLTKKLCRELGKITFPKTPIWTVNYPRGVTPQVVLDTERPDYSNLLSGISLRLLRLPEYEVVADVAESAPELKEGIIIDAGGFLRGPEKTNNTRALVTNFLWRYLRAGAQLDWDEKRFMTTIGELRAELRQKSVTSHITMPLRSLKMGVDCLDFGDEIQLLPASVEELELWLNPKRLLPELGTGVQQWNTRHVDRPAVLHIHRKIVGRPPPTDIQALWKQPPQANINHVITAIRLATNVPVAVIFQEHRSEGLMAFSGHNTSSWDQPSSMFSPVATIDQEMATNIRQILQLLNTSPSIELLRLPLRRWESSLVRHSLEDRLIDAWVGLEALLLGKKGGELSYRASMLLAEFLGTSGPHRKTIFHETRASYKWRSAIVHGGGTKTLEKTSTLKDIVKLTTENLHSALLKALKLPHRFNPERLQSDLLGREIIKP